MANRLKSIARWLVGADQEARQWNDSSGGAWFTPGPASTHVDATSALAYSPVWACETLIADSIATLPVDTYRTVGMRREPTEPPRWLEHPNRETDRVDYDTQRILSLLGWGNAWAILTREGGFIDYEAPVIERWLIEPWRVQVRRVKGEKATFVDGVYVPPQLVQHIRGYTLPGDLVGMSVIAHASQSLSIGVQGDNFAKKFFENGIAPSGALRVPQLPAEVSSSVVDRLRDQFAERYAGTGNARKPLVLTGGTEWQQITLNPADAQMLETRKFQIEEVCRWFRVPVHKVQQVITNASQGGGNGLEQMALEFAQDGLLPWTVRLERADSLLLPPGERLRYNLNAYVRVDLKTRYEAHELAIRAGMATPNDRLALEDEQPIVGGEYVRLPLQTTLLTEETARVDPGVALVVGGLVRAGYEPEDILAQLGLPAIKHTGNIPVTVQAGGPDQGLTQ